MTDSINKKMMSELMKANPDKNVVCSPFSLEVVLALLLQGADGETKQQIEKTLSENIKSKANALSESENLSIANAVYVNRKYQKAVKEEYLNSISDYPNSVMMSGNNSVEKTNAWVREITDGQIQKIIEKEPDDLVLCLLNALAFDGKWMEPYEDDGIHDEEFTNLDGSTAKVSMLGSIEYSYVENELVTGFTKDYKGDFAFMGLLPKKETSKLSMLRTAEGLDFKKLYAGRSNHEVYVKIPEFEFDYEASLTEFCKELGITSLFEQSADLSKISEEVPLMVSDIKQKAKIKLDRHGTKAAVVTLAAVCAGCAIFDRKSVILNRPFFFAIIHKDSGEPVFAGVVNNL